ncbi:MAG TPA: hypothetical protein VMH61_06860 [Candidatus Acidoferrales bacterium]|nr:hypothetical protein [Candidatus Acidoferrales bacterium]
MHASTARAGLLVALALAAAGCGGSSKTSGPTGDDGGTHLLAFATDRATGDSLRLQVALLDLDQQGYRSVSNLNATGSDQEEPCISDDGGFVCFSSNRPGGKGGTDLYLYRRLEADVIAPAPLESSANESWPRFTYDSVRIAFVRDSTGNKRIRLFDGVGDTLLTLPGLAVTGPFDDDEPAPDLHGDRIAFQSNRSGATHVYVWNRAAGVAALPALLGDSLDVDPALTADGRWLAFASNRSGGAGGYDIYLYDLVAGAYVRLPRLNTAGDERHPSVSAGGQLLFFQARPSPSQHWQIWSYDLSDSTLAPPPALIATSGNDRQPYVRWQ